MGKLDKYFRRGADRAMPSAYGQSWRKQLPKKISSTKKGKLKLTNNKHGFHSNTIVKYIDGKFITYFKKVPHIGAIKTCLLVQETNESGISASQIEDLFSEQKDLVENKKFEEANKILVKIQQLQELYNAGRVFDSVRGRFKVISNTEVNKVILTEVVPV